VSDAESDVDYLRQIELLARAVVNVADDPVALPEAILELRGRIRYQHFVGDGCVDDGPILHLGGAAIITPEIESYEHGCSRLGVDPRPEGWALWYTWDDRARAHTMVTTAFETTRGLLENWAQGRDVHPAQPDRAQIAAVVRGWPGPIVLSPGHSRHVGLHGR
jgi:hypothetical protein